MPATSVRTLILALGLTLFASFGAADDAVAARSLIDQAVESRRLGETGQALEQLKKAHALIAPGRESAAAMASERARARLALTLGTEAAQLGAPAVLLAFAALDQARQLATRLDDSWLAAQAYDGMSELYERQGRDEEALRLAERGLLQAQGTDARDLLIRLEWRCGRLLLRLGQEELARAAYRRAVEHIEAVRADIPVRYLDGRSSFRATLEPIYLGLTDLLLREADRVTGAQRTAFLQQARDTVELIKQTELEDYLRDRCTVDAARGAASFPPPPATAILYPIMLPDRLELLLETSSGIERRTVNVDAETLSLTARGFATALRSHAPYRVTSARLYSWLLAPLQELLAAQRIETLVVVPDGVLRLVPLAALHDGKEFLIQRLAVATVPGLSITANPRAHAPAQALLAGLSEPGPVVDRLPLTLMDEILAQQPVEAGAAPPGASRSMTGRTRQVVPAGAQRLDPAARTVVLRDALALPGVKREIADISQVLGGKILLDQSFTLDALRVQLLSADFPVLHIASHGVFGDSAEATFVMAYDDLLTLDRLQSLLGAARLRDRPIELITLSACQTAEGDDRAPLGLSGMAIKARALSALGTLWPVDDEAASALMAKFYRELASGKSSKVAALRAAQAALLADPAFEHPFFWAPFVLVGNWL